MLTGKGVLRAGYGNKDGKGMSRADYGSSIKKKVISPHPFSNFEIQKHYQNQPTISHKIFETNSSLVFKWNSALWEKFNCQFWGLFC